MKHATVSCVVCRERPATCFDHVCNNCMVEITAVLLERYPAQVAAYKIDLVTNLLLQAECETGRCHTARVQLDMAA
jgi:hypothetical protein